MSDAGPTIQLSMAADDVAVLTFDQPGSRANLLSSRTLDELKAHLDTLESRDDLAGVVLISAKDGIFIAGADIKEFGPVAAAGPERAEQLSIDGRELLRRLSRLPCVSVAAIHGACVGGGLEMAIWCDRRVVSDHAKTKLAFPEVKLGILPGWGGTQRATRIIGASNTIELACSGDAVDGRAALAMGLVDDVVPPARLLEAAIDLIRLEQQTGQWTRDRKTWEGPLGLSADEIAFTTATAKGYILHKTKGHYPAPIAALDTIMQGANLPIDQGLKREAREFARLIGTDESRNLINFFFVSERIKKDPGIADRSIKPRDIKSVGVIGAGLMGSGIAAAAARRGLPTYITDADSDALAKGVGTVMKVASFRRENDPAAITELMSLVRPARDLTALRDCDLIVEAVVENLDVKTAILRELVPQLPDDTIVASNTSTISITEMSQVVQRPDRFVGLHFFNPVHKMPLVEVIRGQFTSDQTVATVVAYAKRINKSPIVVLDGPGFLVNRLLLPYMTEATILVQEGADFGRIDKVATRFGLPMGPITLFDVVGLDTALFAGKVMHRAFPDRMADSSVLAALVEAGRLGQKTGSGFYRYVPGKKKGQPDPDVESVIAGCRQEKREHTDDEIRDRLFLPMLLEATRVLDEKKVRDVRDVDAGLILGIGFPPFRGGICRFADAVGARTIVDRLDPLRPLGARFTPTPMIEDMARTGRKFYEE